MDLNPLKIDRGASKPAVQAGAGPIVGTRGRRSLLGPALIAGALLLAFLLRGPLLRLLDRVTLPRVRVVTVEESDPREVGAVRGTAANGYVVAARRAALSADTPGRIVEMRVEEGTAVKKGQVVARLFSEELEALVVRGEAEVDAAKASATRVEAERAAAEADLRRAGESAVAADAQLAMSRADLDLAKAEIERVERLIERDVATGRELDNAKAAFRRGQAMVADAEARRAMAAADVGSAEARLSVSQAAQKEAAARVAVAGAALQQARATLSKTEVRAPFDGVVVLKDAEVGEVVSPNVGGGTSARGSVVTMVDFASLEVQVDLPETSLKEAKPGGPAQIFLDAFPERPYRGRVDRIWPTASRQKATVEVRVAFVDPDERLRPDMGVRVVFLPEGGAGEQVPAGPRPETKRELLVPEAALARRDGVEGVFLLEGDVVRFRPVDAGEPRNGRVAIKSGVERSDPIVSPVPASLVDGDRVIPEESK